MKWLLRLFVALVLLAIAPAAPAHEETKQGDVTLRVGWLNEPTYSGSVNAVQVDAARGEQPATGAALSVVVLFGARNASTRTDALRLEPSDEVAGRYTAGIIPTRPGSYTFHVTGTIGGTKIDRYFTSGEKTFDDVRDPTANEFPAKDPTAGQLAERVDAGDRSLASTRSVSRISLGLSVLALAAGLFALARRSG